MLCGLSGGLLLGLGAELWKSERPLSALRACGHRWIPPTPWFSIACELRADLKVKILTEFTLKSLTGWGGHTHFPSSPSAAHTHCRTENLHPHHTHEAWAYTVASHWYSASLLKWVWQCPSSLVFFFFFQRVLGLSFLNTVSIVSLKPQGAELFDGRFGTA